MNTNQTRPITYVIAFSYMQGTWEYFGVFETLKKAKNSAARIRKGSKFQTMIYKGCLGGELIEDSTK